MWWQFAGVRCLDIFMFRCCQKDKTKGRFKDKTKRWQHSQDNTQRSLERASGDGKACCMEAMEAGVWRVSVGMFCALYYAG